MSRDTLGDTVLADYMQKLAEKQTREKEMNKVFFKDSQEAFEAAIEDGFLTLKPWVGMYAGDYMYMGSEHRDGKIVDYFKNCFTRHTVERINR